MLQQCAARAALCVFVVQVGCLYLIGSARLLCRRFSAGGNGQQREGRVGPGETWALPYLRRQVDKQADGHTHIHTHTHRHTHTHTQTHTHTHIYVHTVLTKAVVTVHKKGEKTKMEMT